MTYIIAEPCIDVKDRGCVDVCPVDCIYEGPDMLYIPKSASTVARANPNAQSRPSFRKKTSPSSGLTTLPRTESSSKPARNAR